MLLERFLFEKYVFLVLLGRMLRLKDIISMIAFVDGSFFKSWMPRLVELVAFHWCSAKWSFSLFAGFFCNVGWF